MKISINNLQKSYSDLQIQSKETHKSPASLSDSSNFDKLLIRSDPRKIEEASFAGSLSGKLSKEVASFSADFGHIRSMVQNHTYQIDADRIAARILLVGEE